jgi:hypothetical protein
MFIMFVPQLSVTQQTFTPTEGDFGFHCRDHAAWSIRSGMDRNGTGWESCLTSQQAADAATLIKEHTTDGGSSSILPP